VAKDLYILDGVDVEMATRKVIVSLVEMKATIHLIVHKAMV
jgi:hypothetical protein